MSHEIKYCILIFGQTSSGVYGGDEKEARKARREDGGKNSIIQYFPPNFVALSVWTELT